jgi:hypothetical protein
MRKDHAMKISKLASRRTMRVATMFTGVAASAAAFAPFAPAAHASIQENVGCANVPNWFHTYDSNDPGKNSVCFGYRGNSPETIEDWQGFCGGTNYGSFSAGYTSTPKRGTFGPGTTIYWFTKAKIWDYQSVYMNRLMISRWSGTDTCPQPYQ